MVGSPLLIAEKARSRLQSVIASVREGRSANLVLTPLPNPADIVITPCEVNNLHGTGTLLLRIFKDSSSVVSLRTSNFYDHPQAFGAANFCLPLAQASRSEIQSWVKWWLSSTSVRRILCLPYLPTDPLVGITAKELFNVPLCTYIMDDKNVCTNGIPDPLMQELLAKSDLRLVISPEMREAYEKKYGLKFYLLPPLVSDELLRRSPLHHLNGVKPRHCVLIGNIWGQRWLDLLRGTFRNSGFQVDWYCNQKTPRALSFDRADLERDGIKLLDPIAEDELPAILSQYSYAIVPSDTLDGKSPPSVQAIAELSLPSRIPFMISTSHLPIVVLGHPETSAARFVERFRLGAVVPYDTCAVRKALEQLSEPETHSAIRGRAAALSASFSARGSADWIWRSLERGQACDLTYEKLMPPSQTGDFNAELTVR